MEECPTCHTTIEYIRVDIDSGIIHVHGWFRAWNCLCDTEVTCGKTT